MSTSQSTHQTMNRLGDSQQRLVTPEAGHAGSYWSWLLFKEAKQLAPLFIALIACGLVLHLIGQFGEQHEQATMHGVSLLMVPILFAIGSGPMLVSQEKEQHTLSWIGSLPIDPRSIVLSKLIICVLGLALSWIISIGMTWLIAPSVFNSHSFSQIDLLYRITSTFALLSTGFALAWIFPTAISSLIALAVCSCAMTLLGGAILSITYLFIPAEVYDRAIELGILGLFSLAAALLAVLYGQRAFVAGAQTESIFSFARWRSERQSQHGRPSFWTQSPSSSLIWQISRQNSLLWSGLLLIAILAGCLLCAFRLHRPSETDIFLAVLPVCLVLSWLGASVFGSDAYRDRINFLAQRGVAPGLIWWTRMILPVGIVGLISLSLFFAIQMFGIGMLVRLFVGVGISIVLMIFAFTQWFSQWTRSTLISFCVAPAVAVMVIGYQIFIIQFLHAPWWILLAPCAIAMLATRLMLCPWMDGRSDLRYWIGHGVLLLVALGIPLIPFVYTWATYPDMPPATKRSLAAEVEEYQQSPRAAEVDLVSNKRTPATDEDAEALSQDFAKSISDRLDSMEQELKGIDGPIAIPGNKFAITTANLLSLRMDSMTEPNTSDDQEQTYRQRYRQVMLLLDDQVRHLRLSERLQEQEYADYVERWMVSELSQSGRRKIFTDQQYARIVAGLADQDGRNQARRRAIVMAWEESNTQRDHQFENVLATDRRTVIAPRWLIARRDAAMAAEELLKRLESSVPTPISYPGELDSTELWWSKPGMLWHRPWETKAKKLAESLESTPATKGNDDE